MSRLLLVCLLLLTTSTFAEPLKFIEKKHDSGVNISAKNLTNWPVTVRITPELQNLKSNTRLPHTAVLPPNRTIELVRLRAPNSQAWRYSYKYHWRHGDYRVQHKNTTTYRFPYNGKYKVIQGANGAFSHTGESANAIDFGLPVGTPVVASREGYVVEVKKHFTKGAPDRSLYDKANRVLVIHSDGTVASYFHFRHNGVLVKEGQKVKRGQMLGYSGNTGFSDGPHLHIGLSRPAKNPKLRVSIPIKFKNSEGVGFAVEGRSYSSR